MLQWTSFSAGLRHNDHQLLAGGFIPDSLNYLFCPPAHPVTMPQSRLPGAAARQTRGCSVSLQPLRFLLRTGHR